MQHPDLRSNPQYFHVGINSAIGSRLELYQMFSGYNQTVIVQQQDGNLRNAHEQSDRVLCTSEVIHFHRTG